jgi:uncharacterized protein YggT (Ycf19 family)
MGMSGDFEVAIQEAPRSCGSAPRCSVAAPKEGQMFVIGNLLHALAVVLDIVLNTLLVVILVNAVLSWVRPDPSNPIVMFLERVSDLVCDPIRRPVSNCGVGDRFRAIHRDARDLVPARVLGDDVERHVDSNGVNVRLTVRVQPGAKQAGLAGRTDDGTLKVRVTAPPRAVARIARSRS